jgi:hypothetical protein
MIKSRHLDSMRPLLEAILSKVRGTNWKASGALPEPAGESEMLMPLPVLHL